MNWPEAWNVIFVKTDTTDVLLKSQQKPGLNRQRIVPPCSHYRLLTGLSLATTDRVIIFLFSLSKTMETFTFPLVYNLYSLPANFASIQTKPAAAKCIISVNFHKSGNNIFRFCSEFLLILVDINVVLWSRYE